VLASLENRVERDDSQWRRSCSCFGIVTQESLVHRSPRHPDRSLPDLIIDPTTCIAMCRLVDLMIASLENRVERDDSQWRRSCSCFGIVTQESRERKRRNGRDASTCGRWKLTSFSSCTVHQGTRIAVCPI
jgi:hypothetical protein